MHIFIFEALCILEIYIIIDERMSVSPVETLEKALGLHFISKMGLTCL